MKRERKTLFSEVDQLPLEIMIEQPDEKPIKGIVQISHGMAEHKERYETFMDYLAQNGYVAVIHDHRGHGKSQKRKEDQGFFYDETSNAIVEDVYQVTRWIKEKYPNQKITLFGHSMGSMVVRKYSKTYDKEIDQLIVCGSPSKNSFTFLALELVRILSVIKGKEYRSKFIQKLAFGNYNKRFGKVTSENAWICSDEQVVKKYDEDEECGFIFTLNGFQNLFLLMKEIYQVKGWQVQYPDLPILFVAGEEDPVIQGKKAWEKSQEFLRKRGYHHVTGKLYPHMRHEILNETGKEEVFQDILQWMEKNK